MPAAAQCPPGGPRPADDPLRAIATLFADDGARGHPGERVSQAAHMLQAAALAESAGAPPALVAAALLHDVGHFAGVVGGHVPTRAADAGHSAVGADWLARWFGPEVTEPVRLHAAAKRYLCAVEPGYAATLSPASVRALDVPGGAMDRAETAVFEASPHACAALRLRRWDDAAKEPDVTPPAFAYYQSLLRRLLPGRPLPGRPAERHFHDP